MAEKPEKVSMTLKQWHKRKEEREKNEIRESDTWCIKCIKSGSKWDGFRYFSQFYSYNKMHRKRISVDDELMSLVAEIRKARRLIHRLTHKNKHPIFNTGDDPESHIFIDRTKMA